MTVSENVRPGPLASLASHPGSDLINLRKIGRSLFCGLSLLFICRRLDSWNSWRLRLLVGLDVVQERTILA